MKLAIMQPYVFPYIGYWQLMNEVDAFIFYDNVNFIKKGYVNRNSILINGLANKFTIPLINASQNRLINEIEIDYSQKWSQKLLNSIFLTYKKALNFEETYLLLTRILNENYRTISELNVNSSIEIAKKLKIKTAFLIASELDYKTDLKGEDKILKYCELKGAVHYINPVGGVDIYDEAKFESKRIKLSFLKTNPTSYKQLGKQAFVDNLSIIDVLMNNSFEDVCEMLSQFELKSKS
ncbi:WbqC family protein [Vicingaceae bacterium]|nr:WbqC family protein [Vicingaceae bacterium]